MRKMDSLLTEKKIQARRDAERAPGITFFSNEKWFPPMIGHKAVNKRALEEKLGKGAVSFAKDDSLADGEIRLGYVDIR